MDAVREVTVWDVDYRQPNHDYLLDGDRIIATRDWGEGPVKWLSGRMKLDRRGRKFVKLEPNPFEGYRTLQPAKTYREVQGSKGEIYKIDVEAGTCTCMGFQFRGTCKHLKES